METKFYIEKLRTITRLGKEKQLHDNEQFRLETLTKTIADLKAAFRGMPDVNVYLFGSITEPYGFTKYSDIDIAVGNYQGSRLDLFCQIEMMLNFKIDLVILEKCSFREDIIKQGFKIQ